MAAIVAENVGRRYGDTLALDDVSLSVSGGTVFALVGPNGAGKTTLVRALTGTTAATGDVRILGETPAAVDRERLGLLPQAFSPPERLTARELLGYYGGLYDEAREVDAVLADVGLTDAADVRYEHLSGGQQRRVCVGTAVVNNPDLLFLDEPTTGIDPAGRRSLWSLIDGLAAGGTTVLLTTHDMAEAEHHGDRVGLLSAGELLAVDTPAALIESYGGERVLRVETAGADAPDLGYPTTVTDDGLAIRGVPPGAIGDILVTLDSNGLDYGTVEWREPDLEDVYLALAGGRTDTSAHPHQAQRGGERA